MKKKLKIKQSVFDKKFYQICLSLSDLILNNPQLCLAKNLIVNHRRTFKKFVIGKELINTKESQY